MRHFGLLPRTEDGENVMLGRGCPVFLMTMKTYLQHFLAPIRGIFTNKSTACTIKPPHVSPFLPSTKKQTVIPPEKNESKKHVQRENGRDYFQKGNFIFQLPILNFQVSGLVKSFIDPSLDPPGVANIPLEPIPRATSSSSRQKKKQEKPGWGSDPI